jgi:hypothetical protein
MLLAGSTSAMAQDSATASSKTLKPVVVKEKADAPEGKDALRAVETTIGKGTQLLRDIPQSVTVVTERLIDERNLDTVQEALKSTSGISFQAAEGGEEDIKLRGFSLASTGDIFVDGMRDPAFYERDTFSLDRMEVMRGSASMLFGRGSTGGAVNLVNKAPTLFGDSQVDVTLGTLQAQHSALFDDLLLDAITWDDITWLLANTRLPVLLKGITHPQDAVQAQQLGVAHVLRLLRDELEIAMALCGCATLAQVNADCLLTDAWPNKQADPTADNPNPACGGLQ